MSQTILQQILDYYTDKTTSMAVKLARQHDQIRELEAQRVSANKTLMELDSDLGSLRCNIAVLVQAKRDLETEMLAAHKERDQAEEQLASAKAILSMLLVSVVTVGMDGTVYYYADYVDPIKDAAYAYFNPAPATKAS